MYNGWVGWGQPGLKIEPASFTQQQQPAGGNAAVQRLPVKRDRDGMPLSFFLKSQALYILRRELDAST